MLLENLPFQILDEPGPPRNLRNETVTNTSISVKWQAPIFDGNSPITNYTVVSYKSEDSIITMVNLTNNTSISLINLSPPQAYVIVVFANNNHFSGSPNHITVVTADARTVFHSSVEPFLPPYKDGNYLCWCSFLIHFSYAGNEVHQNRLNSIYVLVKQYFLLLTRHKGIFDISRVINIYETKTSPMKNDC